MSNHLKQIEKTLVEWTPFIVCLFIFPGVTPANVFASSKHIILIILLGLIVAIRAIRFKDFSSKTALQSILKQPVSIKIIFLILPIIFSINLLSYNPLVSLFGAQALQTGLLFWSTCLITIWIISRTGDYYPSLKPTIYALCIISILTIAESLGFRPLLFITQKYINLHAPYPVVTVGYRGHLAGLFAYLSLMPLIYFKNYSSKSFMAIFSLSMLALSCTSNTSAFLGVFLALLLGILFNRKRQNIIPLVIFLLLIKATVVLAPINSYLYNHHIVSEKLGTKNLSDSTTLKTRLYLWKSAIHLFEKRPVFGWGIDNYNMLWYTALNKADADNLLKLEFNIKDGQKFSRINDSIAYVDSKGVATPILAYYYSSHSSTFDMLYGQGAVGLVLYIFFIFITLKQLSKNMQSKLFIMPALAYFVYLQAWFPTITNMALFAVLLGIGLSYSYYKEEEL